MDGGGGGEKDGGMTSVATRTSAPAEGATLNPAAQVLDKVRSRWAGMAGRIGLMFCGLGFVVIGVAWNGAASNGVIEKQMPYLVSGGLIGLSLVIIGGALLIAESNRRDRAILEHQLIELTAAVQRLSASTGLAASNGRTSSLDIDTDTVVAGRSSFHLPGCRLVEGRSSGGTTMSREAAEAAGLSRCRVCGS